MRRTTCRHRRHVFLARELSSVYTPEDVVDGFANNLYLQYLYNIIWVYKTKNVLLSYINVYYIQYVIVWSRGGRAMHRTHFVCHKNPIKRITFKTHSVSFLQDRNGNNTNIIMVRDAYLFNILRGSVHSVHTRVHPG